MKYIAIVLILFCVPAFGQYHTTVNIGEGSDTLGVSDSMGLVVPLGEIVIGTGTKAPTSTDSLAWNAGLFVTGPVRFDALVAGALDSLAYFDPDGDIGKIHVNDLGISGGGDSMGIAVPFGAVTFGLGTKTPGHDKDHLFWNNSSKFLGVGFSTPVSTIHLHDSSGTSVFRFTDNTSGASSLDGIVLGMGTGAPYLVSLESTDFTIGTNYFSNPNGNMSFKADGSVTLPEYTGATFDDTPAKYLGLNSSQEVITFSAPSGSDSMGLVMPTGYLLIGRGDALPDTSSGLFWDGSGKQMSIGHTSPLGDLHVIGTAPTTRSAVIAQNDQATTDFTATFPALSIRNTNSTNGNYARINFQDESTPSAAAIGSQITDHTNNYGTIEFWTRSSGGNTQKMVITESGGVGIGGTPAASAKLDVSSTTQGLKIPTMTSTQRDAISSPAAGIIIYNTTTTKLEIYNGSWTAVH